MPRTTTPRTTKPPRRRERLLALLLLALVLFSPPLVMIADRPLGGGLSALPLYLLLAWALVIGLAAWLLEGGPREEDQG
ncbi:hypothetical protein PRZ61_10355 [Halomonas pacifica]|uniref:hypothetical protein n=1 Tax=Bisbaumannia pacifica TaxID=77098 RepID=UPI002359D99F|nr:hypothetical protein [Halomonas pacifica]MDC8803840.1 hypothetical protein [Halomonas pacifica]